MDVQLEIRLHYEPNIINLSFPLLLHLKFPFASIKFTTIKQAGNLWWFGRRAARCGVELAIYINNSNGIYITPSPPPCISHRSHSATMVTPIFGLLSAIVIERRNRCSATD